MTRCYNCLRASTEANPATQRRCQWVPPGATLERLAAAHGEDRAPICAECEKANPEGWTSRPAAEDPQFFALMQKEINAGLAALRVGIAKLHAEAVTWSPPEADKERKQADPVAQPANLRHLGVGADRVGDDPDDCDDGREAERDGHAVTVGPVGEGRQLTWHDWVSAMAVRCLVTPPLQGPHRSGCPCLRCWTES